MRRNTPAAMRLFSGLEIRSGSQCGTSGRHDHQRSWIRNGHDRARWVRSSIGMLTNQTFHMQSRSTTFPTSPCSTAINLPLPASSHLNHSRRWSRTLRNGKLTGSSNLNNLTGSSIMLYTRRITDMYGLGESLQRISWMRRNCSMIFTKRVKGSLDEYWTRRSGIGCFSMRVSHCFLSYGSRPSTDGVGTCFYHLQWQVKWMWSFPVHRMRRKAAHKALASWGTYYVVQRRTHWFCFFLCGFSSYIYICGSPGGLLLKGGMM